MKIVIDIPEEIYRRFAKAPRTVDFNECVSDRNVLCKAIRNGIPFDSFDIEKIRAEIQEKSEDDVMSTGEQIGLSWALDIIDNIGKGDKE